MIIHRKKPDSNALVAKGRKDPMLVRIEEDIEKKNPSSKYALKHPSLKVLKEIKKDEE